MVDPPRGGISYDHSSGQIAFRDLQDKGVGHMVCPQHAFAQVENHHTKSVILGKSDPPGGCRGVFPRLFPDI